MWKTIRIAAWAALIAGGSILSTVATAQEVATPASGRQPGGRVQGGQSDGERARRTMNTLQYFGPAYTWTIAFWPEVREALNIDRDQMMALGRLMLPNRPPVEGASGDPEGAYKRYHLNNDEAVLKTVKPDQRKRLQELFIQYNGGMALTKFEVAKEVGISEDVKAKITTLVRANSKLIREEAANRKAGKEIKNPIDMTKMFKEAKTTIESWLTPAQLEKLKELGGEKFNFREHSMGSVGRGDFGGMQGPANGGRRSGGAGVPNRAGGGASGGTTGAGGSGGTQTGVRD